MRWVWVLVLCVGLDGGLIASVWVLMEVLLRVCGF